MDNIQDMQPNFRDEQGKLYLVHCYKCNKENYSIAVASGQCAWCGYKEDSSPQTSESEDITS